MKHTLIALVLTLYAVSATAQGSRFHVYCDKGEKINKLLNTIVRTNLPSPITITVSGACKESVSIQNSDRVTLRTLTGAVISGVSKDVDAAVTVNNSSFVAIEGFLIRGGANGVLCEGNSVCNLTGLTVEGATNDGVRYERSGGVLAANLIENHGFRGISAVNGSKILLVGGRIQDNAQAGIGVISGSEITLNNVTIQNNALEGLVALLGSSVRIFDSTIISNGSSGIGLYSQSNGSLEQTVTGNVVTGNAGNGVFLRDLSFARFEGTNTVSGNSTQPDVECAPQFPATRGAGTVAGTTNCVEPEAAGARKDSR